MRLSISILPLAALCLTPALHARPLHGAAPASAITAALADTSRSDANRALDEGRKPAAVLAFAAIPEGATVVDWMAGGGYYSELIADVVGPRGHVVSVLAEPYYKAEPWAKVTAAHPNIQLQVQPAGAATIPPASADMIFAHLEFHDLYNGTMRGVPLPDPQAVLAMWRKALKPGGTVIIADHNGREGLPPEVRTKLHRMAISQAEAEMERAGFKLVAQSDALHRSDDNYDLSVFDPATRGHTDRYLLKFKVK